MPSSSHSSSSLAGSGGEVTAAEGVWSQHTAARRALKRTRCDADEIPEQACAASSRCRLRRVRRARRTPAYSPHAGSTLEHRAQGVVDRLAGVVGREHREDAHLAVAADTDHVACLNGRESEAAPWWRAASYPRPTGESPTSSHDWPPLRPIRLCREHE